MTHEELEAEVANLRHIVNALCVGVVDEQKDLLDERIRMNLKSPAGARGYRLLRTGIAKAALDSLEYQKQIILEDNPDLKGKP